MDVLECVLVCVGAVVILDRGGWEGKRADFGLADVAGPGEGPGEGDGEPPFLAKGLRRCDMARAHSSRSSMLNISDPMFTV